MYKRQKRAIRFRRHHPERIILVAYESLFSEDPRTLRLICRFLGVAPPTDQQHQSRLQGAKRTAGKHFLDLGDKPENVPSEQWDDVEHLMRRLSRNIRPPMLQD